MNYLPYFHICAVCVNCDVILFNQSTRTQLKSIRSNVHFAECFIRCSFVDCCHWICVDRKPMRQESPFSRTGILRIVFYEIRKTGNGSVFFRCIL